MRAVPNLLAVGPCLSLNDGVVFVNGSVANASSRIVRPASDIEKRQDSQRQHDTAQEAANVEF